jgi:hypothetical protein
MDLRNPTIRAAIAIMAAATGATEVFVPKKSGLITGRGRNGRVIC